MTVADAPTEAPRARLLRAGAQALSDAELLAVVLRNGRPGASALDLAANVLVRAGGLAGLAGHPERLRCNGMGLRRRPPPRPPARRAWPRQWNKDLRRR